MPDDFDAATVTEQPGRAVTAAEPSARPRFGLRSLFIAMMAICVVLAVLVPSIRASRLASLRIHCSNNMKLIALALLNYHDVYKKFPWAITYAADGTAMHSWRVRLGPYLNSEMHFGSYDYRECWNGPTNRLLKDANQGPAFYRCPSAPTSQNQMCTNYVMLIDDRPGKPNGPPNRPGSVPPCFDDKSAVIVVEIADSDIHWMEPRDVLLSELSMKINDRTKRSLSSYHGGACIAHVDGSVEILDETTTEERVRELLAQ